MRSLAVALLKTGLAPTHGMNQVIRHFDSLQGRKQGFGTESIGLDNSRAFQAGVKARNIPHHAGDLVPSLHQSRKQLATDIAGRACDQNSHEGPEFKRQISKLSRLANITQSA